jgi:predicted metal-dependent hydrolase
MSATLTVRRLRIDLDTPLPRHWAGDAFRTAFFNALSMSFPVGEQLFIDAVRMGLQQLPEDERVRFEPEVRGFIGQEATHRRVHALYNEQLAARGIVNHWERRILARRARRLEGQDTRVWLGVTAATEHFTAVLAEWLLTRESALAGAEPRVRDLWLWHASEESEHRSTAFDLYRALGGSERWRLRIFRVVTLNFTTDVLRQTLHNLHVDGQLWRWATWRSAARTLFGADGLMRFVVPRWRTYLRPDFHPSQGDGEPGRRWLAAHSSLAPPVGDAAGA